MTCFVGGPLAMTYQESKQLCRRNLMHQLRHLPSRASRALSTEGGAGGKEEWDEWRAALQRLVARGAMATGGWVGWWDRTSTIPAQGGKASCQLSLGWLPVGVASGVGLWIYGAFPQISAPDGPEQTPFL